MIRSHLDSSPRHTERTNVASTATSERQFAGKAAREAQNVGFALSRRQHQEVRNVGAAFQDEQEPGGGEAGRASKRSQRPQRGNARPGHYLWGISRRHRPSLPAVQVETVNGWDHREPHHPSSGPGVWRQAPLILGPYGTAIVPWRQGGEALP